MRCVHQYNNKCLNLNCGVYMCPLVGNEDLCKYFAEDEEEFTLTPKGCFMAALNDSQVCFSENLINEIWDNFKRYMKRMGHVQEEEQ